MKKIAVFASGSGSNAENIVKYFRKSSKELEFLFLTNNAKAIVNERAKKLDVEVFVFTRDMFKHTNLVVDRLKEFNCDLIVLAGFLWLLPENLVRSFENKIINIHPALLPKYGGKGMYGAKIHQTVYDNRESETGITIHYVNLNYDEGNVIMQQNVKLDDSDVPEDIEAKVHELEYEYYPKVIEDLLFEKD